MLGNQPAESRGVPGRVGIRFEDDGVSRRQGGPELVEDHLDREVGRGDGADHADGLLDHGAHVAVAEQSAALQHPLPFEVIDEPRGIAQGLGERPVQLGGGDRHVGAADLGDQLLAQVVALRLDRRLQLFQAPLAQRTVGRPVGLVERTPRRGDGPSHVLPAGRSGGAEHQTGCGD